MQYVEELNFLQEAIKGKKHVKAKLELLRERERELIEETSNLKKIMDYEQSDVDRLNEANVVSIFYTIVGKKVEKLDKERKEAIIAEEKYKLAEAEYREIVSDIEKNERELQYIRRCEEKYAELWNIAVNSVIDTAAENNGEVAELKKQISDVEARIKEIDEAIAVGERVFHVADAILEHLYFYKRVFGYYPYTRSRSSSYRLEQEAHKRLKAADNMLTSLQSEITRFRAEISDVDLDFEKEAYPYALVRASNYYLDMLVKLINFDDGIDEAEKELKSLKLDVGQILERLSERKERNKKNIYHLERKINEIISL